MELKIKRLGITIVNDPETADLDIVFVHGLQGHPEATWQSRGHQNETADSTSESKRRRIKNVLGFGGREKNTSAAKETLPPSSSKADHGRASVFWPRDLLGKHESCSRARVMTYGYDSDIFRLVDTVNFTTISSHGEALLNRVAAVRADNMHRPLIFIVHSLGGLVVKSV